MPGGAAASIGSSMQPATSSSDAGLMKVVTSTPIRAAVPSGSAVVKSRSYRRTVAVTAWAAETQWSVAFTLRPSGASPPRVAGS